ncbi:WSC domain-domain-containing protein [Protomyces lactucae-debilis]|uniref:WSC domain-domain-containing protein n=1 Tax=Protomyces lactucae-debilis TaxID=2754530 RepID=A0A1Y2FN79_PROLT|nr:WSC domain-containing protein [Protomyces lactucae-debilis]ORY85433.1 WSC domain-domain-containing protein [Protomyces lactucae-debilis]
MGVSRQTPANNDVCHDMPALPASTFAVAVSSPSSTPSSIQTVNGKQYFTTNVGCYSDDYPKSRVLSGKSYSEPTYNTLYRCAEFCADHGFAVSGAEYGQECYCGNSLPPTQLDSSACDFPCSAKPDEICGGNNALSIQSITFVQSLGCYEDQINYRSLNGASFSAPDMSIEKCAGLCQGFTNYGVEYSNECYCGNGLRLGPTAAANCNMACSGSPNEICGGSNALSVYGAPVVASDVNNVTSIGCFTDFYPQSRVLDGANTASDEMTEAVCSAFCAQRAFTLFGTEFGRECFCGNTLPTVSSSGCTQSCAGDSSEICGGSNAISVYYYNANGAPIGLPVSSSAVVVSSTASTFSSASVVAPASSTSIASSSSAEAVVSSSTSSSSVVDTTSAAVTTSTTVNAITTSETPIASTTSTESLAASTTAEVLHFCYNHV